VPVQVIPGNNMSDEFDPTTPQQNFAAVTDLYAAGFSQNKTLDATAAPGQLYAIAVVDAGVDVSVSGRVGAEQGPAFTPQFADEGMALAPPSAPIGGAAPLFPFSFVARAPEPGSVALIGVGAIALLVRRRRAEDRIDIRRADGNL
jgi:hypothetical protein